MSEEKKNNHQEVIKKIDSLSENLGLKKENQTLLTIKKTDDPNKKELYLEQGSWDSTDPWFAIDEDDQKHAYAFIPADAFAQMIDTLRHAQHENFNLKLEKTIWQNIPADFEDVWVVAMDEIRNHARKEDPNKPISIDLEKLISNIKKEHPNLFINIKDFMPTNINQLQDNHD